jgi:hypothetical protein
MQGEGVQPVALKGDAVLGWIEQRPGTAFAVFLGVHAVLWTALPSALYPNLPLDLIEALTYGREWQLGHDKLPPLPWWLVELVHRAIGRDFAFYLLAQAAVVAAFALVYATAQPLLGGTRALLGILIADGLHFFNYTAAKFNHDVIQLPFWALAGFAFHRALRTGRLGYWGLLGVAVGGALWAKYFVLVLALPLALFLLFDPQARCHIRSAGPYLAVALALAIAAPHLVWLVKNDFLPFAYAAARAAPARGLADHLLHPAEFIAGQIFFALPAALIALPLLRGRRGDAGPRADAFDRRILALLALGPAATVIALSFATGRGTIAMWGYPLWLFAGVFVVLATRTTPDRNGLRAVLVLWGAVTAVAAALFVANYRVLPHVDTRFRAVLMPGAEMARELSTRFRAATGQPLHYVVGRLWDGGNVAHYAPERPRLLLDGDHRRAPWIDRADLKRRGAVVVWATSDPWLLPMPAELRTAAAGAIEQPAFSLPFHRGRLHLQVQWALLPPQP